MAFSVTELIVYDTRLTPVKLNNQPDAILFFSPTAVKSFFSMNELISRTKIICHGKTTAAALKQLLPASGNHFTRSQIKPLLFNMALEYAASHPII